MIEMRHPQRESAQHCYTARDKKWLESQGWVEVKRSVPVLLQSSEQPAIVPVAESQALASDVSDAGVATGLGDGGPIKRKPRSDKGKPRKAKPCL